jgi:hypothetical protein
MEAIMKIFLASSLLMILLAISYPAAAFDCTDNTIFGKKLEEIDDGDFVFYKKSGGVSYYNHVGRCFIKGVHDKASPAISYAFVDGILYARIIAEKREIQEILSGLSDFLKTQPEKIKDGTEWIEYIWKKPDDIVFKVKYNKKTGYTRIAKYKGDIREKLSAGLAADPAEQPDVEP